MPKPGPTAWLSRVLAALFLWGAAAAAEEAPAGLVAGYKALFTCSAVFLADRTTDQIARNQLTGIYDGYEGAIMDLPGAVVHREESVVSVDYDPSMPPRIARYRPDLGCALLPPGADAAVPLLTVSLPPADESANQRSWPRGDKLNDPPAGADARGTPLARVVAAAFDGATYGPGSRTSAVIVVVDGRLAAEAYAPDSGIHVPQRTWSVAKTIMGVLVGIAVREGLWKVDDFAPVPQWSTPGDPRAWIKISNLLHMASGLDAGPVGSRTDAIYFGGGRVEDHALTSELVAPPGTRWFYANNDTLALSYALRTRIGDDAAYLEFPHTRLFRRIGMLHTTAETDWTGTYILSSQVWTTARDLARLGILLANNGVWYGERILPEGWTDFMRTPAPAQPPRTRSDGSPQPGYGAQVWLFNERHGLPPGAFAAMGNRGQYVVMLPERQVVIVRRGFDPRTGRFDIAGFSADVLAALP